MPSDKMLVQEVISGDTGAYEKLYDRYAPLIRAICYDSTGSLADAQDLAQDVFMRAYEKLEHLRDSGRFGKWLVGIARLRCKEWRRKGSQGRSRRVEFNDAQSAIYDTSNDDSIEKLRVMIATLPEKERLALHTFYLQEESAENARRIMGLSRSGFYRVLGRARKRLQKLMVQKQENTQ